MYIIDILEVLKIISIAVGTVVVYLKYCIILIKSLISYEIYTYGLHALCIELINHVRVNTWVTGEPLADIQKRISYFQKTGTDSAAETSGSLLTFPFNKQSASAPLRILYFDNFRIIGDRPQEEDLV